MKKTLNTFVLLVAMLICSPVFSQTTTEALSGCLSDNLTGKERKSLAKWIFLAMGTHPEIKSYSNASADDIKTNDEYMGKLITRLLTVDCPSKLKAAHDFDPSSLQKAFEIMGRVAMQELLASTEVQKSITGYTKFTDLAKVSKVLNQN
jgi:hypothetical protein